MTGMVVNTHRSAGRGPAARCNHHAMTKAKVLLLIAMLLFGASWLPGAHAQCMPVAAEFVLTGLGNPDGNRANHEVGVCLPHFVLNVTAGCVLTVRPKYASAAHVSLLFPGRTANGRRALPIASDPAAEVADAVHRRAGHYYLEPVRCPQAYRARVRGPKLLAADLANLLRRGLNVSEEVLPAVAFVSNGATIAWQTAGPRAQELSYTAISKAGGPTLPDFSPFQGTPGAAHCSLLDINPAFDLDSNPADGVVDDGTATLVGRVPRPVPGRPGHFVCAIAPAGGFVRAERAGGAGAGGGGGPAYRYVASRPNSYAACGAGGYLYKLGAVNAQGDGAGGLSDYCMQCPRGSHAGAGASLCAACPPGFFQDAPGQRACKPCRYGHAPVPGMARCMACYYGRPYCGEGYSPDSSLFTCNSLRLPEGYSPEAGFSLARPRAAAADAEAAAGFSPMFRDCSLLAARRRLSGDGGGDGGGDEGGSSGSSGGVDGDIDSGAVSGNALAPDALLGLNVSAQCRVSLYVLGDPGVRRGGGPLRGAGESGGATAGSGGRDGGGGGGGGGVPPGCSQDAARHAVTAYYTAPNVLAGLGSPGLGGWRVGLTAVLGAEGLYGRLFAVGEGVAPPAALSGGGGGGGEEGPGGGRPAAPTAAALALTLPESGWGYLGGGDNGQGQNSNLKGINFDPCPAGTLKEQLNGDGDDEPGEDPNVLLSHYCVPCGVGAYCPAGSAVAASSAAAVALAAAAGGDGVGVEGMDGGVEGGYGRSSGGSGGGSSGNSSSSSHSSRGGGSSSTAPGPHNCPAGTYGALVGAKSPAGCLNCPAGSYNDADGAVSCRACLPNTFAATPGATECAACGDGYQAPAPGADVCQPCGPGTFRDSAASDVCVDCPAGTSSPEAAAKCTVCGPGTYAASPRSAACTECPRGAYQRGYGQRKCELCPVGTYGDARGRGGCKVCPAGTYNPEAGATSPTACRRCPPGKAAPRPGSGACSGCGPGYFSDRAGAASCRACPTGSFGAGEGARGCELCPRGHYADEDASRGCKPCPLGFYAPSAGAARCMSCPPGAFTSAAGSSSCRRCGAGSYSTRSAAGSAVTCAACPPGTFSFVDGATACSPCPPGQFAPLSGSTGCDTCPVGTYAAAPGSQRCLPCKAGLTTAELGATSPAACRVKVVLNG